MNDPIRLQVLKGATAILADIKPENGYRTDVQAAVRGRAVFNSQFDPWPFISIMEDPNELDNILDTRSGEEALTNLKLIIQGYAIEDVENPTDPAYYLLADIQKAFSDEIRRNGGRGESHPNLFGMGTTVSRIVIGSGAVLPSHAEISDVPWCIVPVSIYYYDTRE